jgi:glycosyltransferase involved in cell wall biosynthesis
MAMYNTERYVHEAIESVLRQDYPHFELVIVDDGSTDGGHEVVQRYSDPRIRLIRTENRGLSAARNRGVDESRGKYVTFLDSDDLLTAMSLSSRLTALPQTGAEVAFSRNVLVVDISSDSGSIALGRAHYASPSWTVWAGKDLISMQVDGTFFVFSQSFMIDRRVFQRIGGFNPLIKVNVDVEFSSRLLPATQSLVETFAPFYVYRRRRDSLSAINSRRKAAESLRTLRQTHRNLAPYLVGREDRVAQDLFDRCVEAFPYWTDEHRRTMAEARHRRGGEPFDLACVGGPSSQAVARLLGWPAGRLVNFASNYLKHNVLASLRI